MTKGYLRQAWLVILLCMVFGAALAGVQAALSPLIDRNLKMESQRMTPDVLLGPAADETQRDQRAKRLTIEPFEVVVPGGGEKKTVYEVFRVSDAAGNVLGWVAKGSGKGFADRIELMVGLDADVQRIKGINVLYQNETPGLGSKIREPEWRRQFADKPAEPRLAITKVAPVGEQVRAITGATISSVSVTSIVNQMIRDLKAPLQERARATAGPAMKQGGDDGR